MLHRLHFGNCDHRALKILQTYPTFCRQPDAQKHRDAKTQCCFVHHHAAASDDAGFGQTADAAPGGGLGQAKPSTDFSRTQGRIPCQAPQNSKICSIRCQRSHNGNSCKSLMVEINISASLSETCGKVRMLSR
ncbi:hypothetical protein D9M69_616700 [compost metagenome]